MICSTCFRRLLRQIACLYSQRREVLVQLPGLELASTSRRGAKEDVTVGMRSARGCPTSLPSAYAATGLQLLRGRRIRSAADSRLCLR